MADEEEGWLESLKRLGQGIFPEPPKPKPAVDMAHWGPTLEAAGYKADSPEYKLLESIGKHVNNAPVPQEVSTGRKLIGTGFNAIGAGLARGAGASVEGALKPTGDMISDWNHRRDLADQGRMNAWKAGGERIIPSVTGAVQTAAQLKRLREVSDQQRERFGYPRIYNTDTPSAGAPAAPGGAPAKPSPGLPGTVITPPAAAPGAPLAAAAPQGAEQRPQGAEDRPYAAGNTRFYTRHWADFFEKNFDAVTAGAAVSVPVKDKDGVSINQEIKTPADLHRIALQEDEKSYHAALPQQAKKGAQDKNIDRSFAALKQTETEAEGAGRANMGLAVFDRAIADLEKAGYRTGPGQDWITSIANWTNSMPGMDKMFDQNRIAHMEAIRKSSIETATEMAKAISQRGATQFEFKTILSAVTNASLSMEGNKRLSTVIRTVNNSKIAEQQLAGQLMQQNGGQLPFDFEQKRLAVQQGYTEKLGAMLDDITREYGGAPAAGGKKSEGGAAPTMGKEEAKAAAKELILKNPGMSAEDAMKQVLGGAAAPPPAATAAPNAPTAPAPQKPPLFDLKTGSWNPDPDSIGGALKKKFGGRAMPPQRRSEDELEAIRRLIPMPQGTP